MSSKRDSVREPQFDREALRELARCYARAAVDELIANAQGSESEPKVTKSKTPRTKR